MTAHNLRIWALVQAQITNREAMIADNQLRASRDCEPGYTGVDFWQVSTEIERLAGCFEPETTGG